ncbi:MAG: site-2 protease family protein [Phycisphaerales bacterium]
MQSFLQTLSNAPNFLLVVIGFSLIIIIHELGHFLAARWAGIRVLAFAVGFGPALVSYRKGLGWRRGSSEVEYKKLVAAAEHSSSAFGVPAAAGRISPTEYRLNALPFGGYVKMLGQDDADATARSDEPDGYQACKVWKRMVVISAGVVMNVILAGVLFVIVFMAGLKIEAPRIGYVAPDFPAGRAVAVNASELGVKEPGLRPGDLVLSIDGKKPANFTDLFLASAMASPGRAIRLQVQRKGVGQPLVFNIVPKRDETSKMLQLGIGPSASTTLATPEDKTLRAAFKEDMERAGAGNVPAGATLIRIGDETEVTSAFDLEEAAAASGGQAIPLEFVHRPAGASKEAAPKHVLAEMKPVRDLETSPFRLETAGQPSRAAHVLGLMPVMGVGAVSETAEKAGLRPGDVFVQIGAVEWPSLVEGVLEIRRHKGSSVRIVVRREDENGQAREVVLENVPVSGKGLVGFNLDSTAATSTRVTAWPAALALPDTERETASAAAREPASVSLNLMRGSRITRVGSREVGNLHELTAALIDATAEAYGSGAPSASVPLTVMRPVAGSAAGGVEQQVAWNLPRSELGQLHRLNWVSSISPGWFENEMTVQKARNPIEAVRMGVAQTHSVMMSTYVTFIRLFQGSVKIEQLKGPVGIADVGTKVAKKGLVWLLFFLALISVNLAVVNFLPIPIADGGHFLFLLYEQIMGKPVSVAVQNIAAIAGLALVIGMFVLVTYNDIRQIIGQ